MLKKDVKSKVEREKKIVGQMIAVYCRGHHPEYDGLCPSCARLREYAWQRSDKCPFKESKTFCSNCKVHCYKPQMREKIKKVMKYSGPRMIFYHPFTAVRHVIETLKEKRRIKNEN